MATAMQSFRFAARSCQCRHSVQRYAARSISKQRAFSSTASTLQDPLSLDEHEAKVLAKLKTTPSGDALSKLDNQLPNSAAFEEEIEAAFKSINRDNGPFTRLPFPNKRIKQTFLNMGDDEIIEEDDIEEDDSEHDDLTPLAHGELEQHREIRHYARLAAWEMPLLASRCPLRTRSTSLQLRSGS